MSKQTTLVPKLRFPEFISAAAWEVKPLDNYSKILRGGSPRPIDEYLTKDVNGLNWLKIGDINKEAKFVKSTEEKVIPAALTKTRVVNPGDLILSNSMSFGRPYILEIQTCIHDGWIAVSDIDKSLDRDYLYYQMMSPSSQTYFSNNAAGSGVQNLNADIIKLLPVPLPSLKEQQKIADCLSSLDELITAQNQKGEALKKHKQGLMQQLFPAEGETVPKLRFPEFQGTEHWEEKRLGDIGSVRMCKRIFKEQTTTNGEIPFYKIGTFGGAPDAFISREVFQSFRSKFPFPRNGAVLISAAGTIGRTVIYKGELAYFQDSNIVWLDNNENLITENFLFYLYQLINWSPSVGTIQRLYNENILGARVQFPSIREQQKIAKFLMSLDDIIIIQTQKIGLLNAFKKGLMQRLFPTGMKVNR